MMEVHMEERRGGGEGVKGKVVGTVGGGGKERQFSTWSSFSSWVCKSFISGGTISRSGRLLERLRSMGFAPLRNWYPKRASSFQDSRIRPEGIGGEQCDL